MRSTGMVIAALVILSGLTIAQGPFSHNGIGPTTQTSHDKMVTMTNFATDAGMSPPPVGGSAGSSTVGGIPVYVYNTSENIDINAYGLATGSGQNGAIAFDTKYWTAGAMSNPMQWWVVAHYVGTAYHETAHIVYNTFLEGWKQSHGLEWLAYKVCVDSLENPDGTPKYEGGAGGGHDPCNQAYSAGTAATNLCADKQAICDNGDMTAEEKADALAAIDKAIAHQNKTCEDNAGDCENCNGPMPEGWGGCPGPCECDE